MRALARLLLMLVGIAVGMVVESGCSQELRKPLEVGQGRITVMNLTEEDWKGVEIWLNRYYRAQFPELRKGARIDAPLDRFEGGFGRRYDPAREQPRGVEVTATTTGGAPIKLVWGTGR